MRRAILSLCRFALCAVVLSAAAVAQPLFSFAVLADVQWAPKDRAGAMDYRGSLDRLQRCVSALNLEKLAFVVQTGDFVDGWEDSAPRTASDLDTVLRVFNRLAAQKVHVAGNHDYRAGASVLAKKFKLKRLYYDFAPAGRKGWRCVVLDANDAGYGIISPVQIEWLKKTLTTATKKKERVLVFRHFPLLREAAPNSRLGNADDVLPVIEGAGNVVAWISGHDHAGGYTLHRGIHHITLRAMVEHPDKLTYAVVQVHEGKLVELGYGDEPVRQCAFGGDEAK